MIINFRSINNEKIWETWDLKNYVNYFRFSPNIWIIWKIRALEKSRIFSFFALRNFKVLFENKRKFVNWWGKRWEFKKKNWGAIPINYRKWVLRRNLPLSHQCPKTYRKSEKMFEEILRNSDEISDEVWEIFLPGIFCGNFDYDLSFIWGTIQNAAVARSTLFPLLRRKFHILHSLPRRFNYFFKIFHL